MDFEQLERAWRSSANSPAQAAAAYVTQETLETLKLRRRQLQGFVAFTGIALTLWSLKIGYEAVVNPFAFEPGEEWAAILLLLLPWVAWLRLVAWRLRDTAPPDPAATMPSLLRALAQDNAGARRRMRFMALVIAVMIPLLAISLGQLVAVGKMTSRNMAQGGVLFGTILAGVAAGMALHYFRRLRPESERLGRLLADYDRP